MFGKEQISVDFHVEGTSRGFLQFSSNTETPFDFGRQTGGTGQVVSNDTVGDGEFHVLSIPPVSGNSVGRAAIPSFKECGGKSVQNFIELSRRPEQVEVVC